MFIVTWAKFRDIHDKSQFNYKYAKWVKAQTGVNGPGEGDKAAGAQTGLAPRPSTR